jgi:phosphatidylglycerophosphate synthase
VVANGITLLRIALVPVIVVSALLGDGLLACAALGAAGATDFLDGHVARRVSTQSVLGSELDAGADILLLASVAATVVILHPEIGSDNAAWLAITGTMYGASLLAGQVAFRRVVNPRQVSGKVAGGALYVFALFTLASGRYEPALLRLAILALMVSSAETIFRALSAKRRADINTIQASGKTSRQRSQSPHAENDVGSRTRPKDRAASSATPIQSETRP